MNNRLDLRPMPLEYASAFQASQRMPRWLIDLSFGLPTFLLIVSLLLPWFNPDSRSPPRVRCASNMRQIGQALQMWANDHGGRIPDQLFDVLDEDLTASVFNCPSANETPAPGATTRAVAANLTAGGHLSYVYLGKGLTTQAASDTVLLYEPLANHQNQGMNVLFADGHVDFLQAKDVQPLLKQVANQVTPVRLP